MAKHKKLSKLMLNKTIVEANANPLKNKNTLKKLAEANASH